MGLRHWKVIVALCALSAASQAAESDSWSEAPLEFIVNSQAAEQPLVVLRQARSALWLEASDFHRLRLRIPSVTPHVHEGKPYYPLNAIGGISLQIDESQQRVLVQAPASAFETFTGAARGTAKVNLTPAALGLFFNYQLSAQRIDGDTSEGALAKVGLFGREGVLSTSGVARTVDGQTQEVRLDSTFTRDFPDRLETLTVGDTISNPGSWGSAVRFAGIHWGTNFSVRPDLITMPLLSAAGTAVLPSVVEVLVDNQRVASQPVSPGPFLIGDVPPVSGAGEVNVVVRDALGRVQVISQSFYSSTTLLASGLSQYSLDLGPVRENYAITSDQYGSLLGAATYRRGLSDELTLEGHAEAQDGGAHAAGFNTAVRAGSFGVLTLTGAAGGAPGSSGWLSGASFEHHAPVVSFTASYQKASNGFREVGDEALTGARFKLQTLLQTSLNLQRVGSLSVAWVEQTFQGQLPQRTLGASHIVGFGNVGTLVLNVSRTSSPSTTTSVFVGFNHALGVRDTANLNAQGGEGAGAPRNALSASLSHSPPIGAGEGYRLGASTTGDYDADWREQLNSADLEAEAARRQGISVLSATGDGTLTWLGGEIYASRTSPESFAVVKLDGLTDVPVYVENQLVAKTDQNGMAFVPNLLPYTGNRISVDPIDLPLDTELDARTTIIAPPFSSGVIVKFPLRKVSPGLFRLVTADGKVVPAGAIVRFNGASFRVALDGVVYVTTFDHGTGGTAEWGNNECHFQVNSPPPRDSLPDMGTILCRA